MSGEIFGTRRVKAAPAAAGSKGVGVFALSDIEHREIIDVSPCIELDAEACEQVRPTPIDDYYFRHPADDDRGLVVLGLASLCNHDEEANAETGYVFADGIGWVVVLTAARRIARGEEITRHYACGPWFTPVR